MSINKEKKTEIINNFATNTASYETLIDKLGLRK